MGRNSLAFLWLGLGTLTVEGLGSVPGRGTKIPQAQWFDQKTKKKMRNIVACLFSEMSNPV